MEYLIRAQDLSKNYGGKQLFEHVSFSVYKNDCIGILGPNGCGKTTLLNVLLGSIFILDGEVWRKENLKIRYLEQSLTRNKDVTIENYIKNKTSGEDIQKKIQFYESQLEEPDVYSSEKYKTILDKIQELQLSIKNTVINNRFEETKNLLEELNLKNLSYDMKLSNLSGGEQRKIDLACIFSQPENCELILLDEPTNHLDIETIEWLERQIADFAGAIILISHDRYLLDDLVDRVFDFQGANIVIFESTFEEYEEQKRIKQDISIKTYKKTIIEEKRHNETIKRMTRKNRYNNQISSKIKRFKSKNMPENPVIKDYLLRFHFQNIFKSGKNIADGHSICKKFSDKVLLNDARFEILSGQKIGLIGRNGCGKTTFLKMIYGTESLDNGYLNKSRGVRCGYFDQGNLSLNLDNDLVGEILRDHSDIDENDAKALLGQFFFKSDDINKKVSSLSGGERSRLAFIRLIMEPYNFLLLDEPTNHMDMVSKYAIEQALKSYNGTVITVSHDRRFLDNVTDTIFLMSDEVIKIFKGNYSMFRIQLQQNIDFQSSDDLVYSSGGKLNKYVVKQAFTEWSSHKKYNVGEEILIGDHNLKMFEWALNNNKLEQLKRKRR